MRKMASSSPEGKVGVVFMGCGVEIKLKLNESLAAVTSHQSFNWACIHTHDLYVCPPLCYVLHTGPLSELGVGFL